MFQLKSTFQTEAAYQSFYPSPDLSPFIFEYWIMNLNTQAEHDKSELEQPKIYPEVIFKFGGDYEEQYLHSNQVSIQSKSTISGVSNYAKASKRVDTKEDLLLVGIKFTSLGMFTLLDMPLIELYNQCITLEDLSIPFLTHLEEKIIKHRRKSNLVELLDREFLSIFNQLDIRSDSIQFFDKIKKLPTSDLKEVLKDQQLNYKYLERKFKKYLGVNPKKLARLLRYQAFYKDWINTKQYKYIDLVYKHNYYDQNHLIKDFKSILNCSPSKFLKLMDTQYTQHITQADLQTILV